MDLTDPKQAYLQYVRLCDMIGQKGLVGNYNMLRQEVLKNHTRKISYDKKNMRYRTYLDNKTQITAKTLEILQDKIFSYHIQHLTCLYSVRSVFVRALLYNRTNDFLAPSTIDRYTVDFNRFIAGTSMENADIRNVTTTEVYAFFNCIMEQNKISAKCLSNIKTVMRLIWGYAKTQEQIDCVNMPQICDNMRFPRRAFKQTHHINRVFKEKERTALFKLLDNSNQVDLGIKLCFYTGIRSGELCAIRREDVDLQNGVLYIRRSEKVCGYGKDRRYYDELPKCYKERIVYISDKAKEILEILCSYSDTWLFIGKNGGHIHAFNYDCKLYKLCKKLGLPKYSMHDIRRTYASNCLDCNVPEKFIQEQLGHSDIATTRKYYYYSTKSHEDYKDYANIVCF